MRNRWRFLPIALLVALFAASGCDNGTSPSEDCDDGSDPPCEAPPPPCTDEVGTICTWAGNGIAGFNGDGLAPRESAFYWPISMTVTEDDQWFILDWNNHRVRHLDADGLLETIIGSDFVGDGPYDLSDLTPPGALGTDVLLNHPTQVLQRPGGDLLLMAWHNHKLRTWDPETGRVVVIVGSAAGYKGDGEDAHDAKLNQPSSAVYAPDGSLFILDQRNQLVRKIDPDNIITTVVGQPPAAETTLGDPGYAGDGGSPLDAKMSQPTGSNPPPGGGIALDSDGRLYFSDTLNHRVRRVDFDADLIETVVGTGEAGFSGDGGPATEAQINNPRMLKVANGDQLYIADENNNRIRVVDLATGTIQTVAGNGEEGFSGDGGMAADASLNRPAGFELHDRYLFIADTYNHRIRRVTLK